MISNGSRARLGIAATPSIDRLFSPASALSFGRNLVPRSILLGPGAARVIVRQKAPDRRGDSNSAATPPSLSASVPLADSQPIGSTVRAAAI